MLRNLTKFLLTTCDYINYKSCYLPLLNSSIIRNESTTFKNTNGIIRSRFDDVHIPNSTLTEYIWGFIDKWSDKVAIECAITGRKFTYRKIHSSCQKMGSALLNLGIEPGEIITVALPNIPEYPIAMLGPMEVGIIVSTINPNYTPDEIIHQIKGPNSRCIICHPNNLDNVLIAKRKLNSTIPIIVTNDFDGTYSNVPSDVFTLDNLISNGKIAPLRSAIKNTDTTLLPFSSGTTGLPKGVCLTHYCLIANLQQIDHPQVRVVNTTNDEQDVLPAILPFFHAYAGTQVLLQGLRKGCKIISMPKFTPNVLLDILEKNKNLVLYVVPPIILYLGTPAVSKKYLDGVRASVTAAAPIGAEDIQKILDKKQHIFIQAYGLTEASPILTIAPNFSNNTDSIGLVISNTKAKIINISTGEPVAIDETGELCFKGPQLMKGYFNNDVATKQTIDEEGWIHTGDIGHYDKDEFFYISDRIKDLIKVKGFQVAPAELEEIIRQHPDIYDVGVIGVPCSKNGEMPVAFIVPKLNNSLPSEDNVKKFVAQKVISYKQLGKIVFVKEIPRNPSGKILRRKLRDSIFKL